MHFFSLVFILTFAFPSCFCTKPIEELVAECEVLYESGEFKQMQENLRDQFDNDPLEILRRIEATGGIDKFAVPSKAVSKIITRQEKLLPKLKETVYVPGKTYAGALKNHLNYYIFGKTNFEVLNKALNECNFEEVNVKMHFHRQLNLDGRVNALKEKRQELLNAIQKQDSRV